MIKIAVTNLGKYNEGELLYKWLELPATEEEINEAFEAIQVAPNTEYEEHFISDYEAPIGISVKEYTSLTKLNEIAERLSNIDALEPFIDRTYATSDVINLAHELESLGYINDANYYVGDILSDEELDDWVKHEAERGGWQRVAHFLAGIEYMSDDYYYMNGYGNMENLSSDQLDGIVQDLLMEVTK